MLFRFACSVPAAQEERPRDWSKVALMKTIESLSAAVREEEAEQEASSSSTSGEEKKQLNQRRETEETSAAAGAAGTEDDGTSTRARVVSALPVRERPADSDKNRQGTVSEVQDAIQITTALKKSEFPEEPATATFSRRSTATFTSRGNTSRFLGNLDADAAAGVDKAAEWRSQHVFNGEGSADGSERTIRAAAHQQQQEAPCKESIVGLEQKGHVKNGGEAKWENGASRAKEEDGHTLPEEAEEKDYPLWKFRDKSVHAVTKQPLKEGIRRELHSGETTSSSPSHGATLLQTSHSRGSKCNTSAPHQPAPFWHGDSQCALLSHKGCTSKHGEEPSVESGDYHGERCRGIDNTLKDEGEGKGASFVESWQIKRSASDGPSAIFGTWRSDYDFRGRIHTHVYADCSREETGLDRQLHPPTDRRHGDYNTSTLHVGSTAVDPAREQKWDQKAPPGIGGTPSWITSSRRDCGTCESSKRCDVHIIGSVSSLAPGVLTGREGQGKLEGGAIESSGVGTGEFRNRSSAPRPESLPQEQLPRTTRSKFHMVVAEWERNDMIPSEKAVLATSPRLCDNRNVCPTGGGSLLARDEGSTRKDDVSISRLETVTVPRGRKHDEKLHSMNTTRTCVSSLGVPPDREGSRRAAEGDRRGSRESFPVCEDAVEKPKDAVHWKDSMRIPPSSKQDDERWNILESGSSVVSGWPSGTNWESTRRVLACGASEGSYRQASRTAGDEGDSCAETRVAPDAWRRGSPGEESEGTRLVRELVEEFDKRRTNFSILVPKVLELVGVLMGRPAGTPLPCVFPRNFSPAAALLKPCPLPICATFSEMGQTSTVEKLERYFPTFNIEGGLLLCTQARRLESGGGGKYYFQDLRGHVIGCHKKHLARYDAQGRVASPVLLKTLLFCLVLKQVSRSKYASLEPAESQVFNLPEAATSGDAASSQSTSLHADRMSLPSCDSGPVLDPRQQQDARKRRAAEGRSWQKEGSPEGSPRVRRSLLDPLPPADALLPEVPHSEQEESSPGCTFAELGERCNELGSMSTSTSSSRGAPTVLDELESPAVKRKTDGGHDYGGRGELLPQGSKLTCRSGSCTSISRDDQSFEESTHPSGAGRLRRGVSTSLAPFAKTQSSADQIYSRSTVVPISSARGSPTSKREAEIWECLSDLRTSSRETKQIDGLPKKTSMNVDRGQQPSSALLRLKQGTGGSSGTDGFGEDNCVEPSRDTRWCPDDEGDGPKSPGTASPALSSATSSASLTSSALQESPSWCAGVEPLSRRPGKFGTLSVVRSSNPQRLVRVYRSLVMEEKTHVVERLLRVWSMTLHARTPQGPYAGKDMCPSTSPSTQEKVTGKKSLARKNMKATARAPRPTGVSEEMDEKHLSTGEGTTEDELEENGTLRIQEIDHIGTDGGDNISEDQYRESVCEAGKLTHERAGERTRGSTAKETFLLRKSNTTECGRILRSVRLAEKPLEGLAVGREDCPRQNFYESVADSANGRAFSRLRRASTSAKGDLKVDRYLTQCRGADEAARNHFICSNNFVRLPSDCNHDFSEAVLSTKRNDAGQSASPSNLRSPGEMMRGDAFLWRPCMSVLWVKPLTVEQTMLKWSKSTPLYDPMEELVAEHRRNTVPAAATRYEEINSLGDPPLSMTLRSAPSKVEISSTIMNSPKASTFEKCNKKDAPFLNSCSTDSARSEPSTSADCTSSLPTSPLFAQASARVGVAKIEQQQRSQQAALLARPQAAREAVDPSPTSMALLHAIQQQILQLLQPLKGGPVENATASRALPYAVQQTPSKAERSSLWRTVEDSNNTSVHSEELSLALRLEKASGGPRRSNTWAAPESHTATRLLEDDSACTPFPEDLMVQQPGYGRWPELAPTRTGGRGVPRAATSELHKSVSESPVKCSVPLVVATETEDSGRTGMTSARGPGGCPVVALERTQQSHRWIRTSENATAAGDSQKWHSRAAPAQENGCREAAARLDEASPSSSRRRSDGGQVDIPCESKDEAQGPAAIAAEALRHHEGGLRGEAESTEDEMGRASQRDVPNIKAVILQKTPEQDQSCGTAPVPGQAHASSSKTMGTADGTDFTTGDSKVEAFQDSTQLGNDMDSLSLISRLLGLSVKAHSTEEEGDVTPTQELRNAARGSLAAETAQALAALLSSQGVLSQTAKSDNGVGGELSPSVVSSGTPSEDQALPSENGLDQARRSGQSSRKRGLDTVDVQKQDEREAEGWKKVAGFQPSLSATAHIVERTCEDTTEFLQQYCNTSGKKISTFTQRQKKKTKWTALHSDEIPPEDTQAAEALHREQPSEVKEKWKDCPPVTLKGGLTDETCNKEERLLACGASWEQQSTHEGLLDLLFAQVLQNTSSPTNALSKNHTE